MRFPSSLLFLGLATTALALPKGGRVDHEEPEATKVRLTWIGPSHPVFTNGSSFGLPSAHPPPSAVTMPSQGPKIHQGGFPNPNHKGNPHLPSGVSFSGLHPTGKPIPYSSKGAASTKPSSPSAATAAAANAASKVKGAKIGVAKVPSKE
ncbi:hypothetical protein ABW19_dt0208298 [Dactylella cylindrospora]|nr:hypothetical protein ABW19_dt0208298 [Dactylella cylindrospora]